MTFGTSTGELSREGQDLMGRHSVEDIFGSICILRDAHKSPLFPSKQTHIDALHYGEN